MSPMSEDQTQNCSFLSEHECDRKEDEMLHSLQSRTLRSFKTSEEYLFAMKEDLAEWFNKLYSLCLTAEDFIDKLETGVILCRHANNVLQAARRLQNTTQIANVQIPEKDVVYRVNVKPQTFQARDNVSNFISWCRAFHIRECLLFETDDIVLRKNERSFILCLLEVARKGSQYGVIVPLIVQMEQEIDRELQSNDSLVNSELETQNDDQRPPETATETESQQNITNDLKHLHQRVSDLLSRCSCPTQFPMIKIADGKYRIGEGKTIIFVRILRNHVMVRVGGGWDTLEHYLYKHDPCRCPTGHKMAKTTKLTFKTNKDGTKTELLVTYDRLRNVISPNSLESDSSSPTLSSASMSRRSSSSSLGTYSTLQACSTPNLVQSYLSSHLYDVQCSRSPLSSDDYSISSNVSVSNTSVKRYSVGKRNGVCSPLEDLRFAMNASKDLRGTSRKTRRRATKQTPSKSEYKDIYLLDDSNKSELSCASRRSSLVSSSSEDMFSARTAAKQSLTSKRISSEMSPKGFHNIGDMNKSSRIPTLASKSAKKCDNLYLSKSSKDLTVFGKLSFRCETNLTNLNDKIAYGKLHNNRRSVISLCAAKKAN